MKSRPGQHWLLVLIVVSAVAAAQEPLKPKVTPRIGSATRQVTMFSALELQLLQAIQKKDKAGLEALLTDDLSIAMPEADELAGDEWVDSVMDKAFSLKSFAIRHMNVADLGDSAVVKFERQQQATLNGKNESGQFFVVDLWKKSGDSWKLANRYVAKIGDIPATTKIEPKPSGKN
jgi:ketosteroid isomerase-like protein